MAGPQNIPIGGSHMAEKQILNILRRWVPDPGIDNPNIQDGTGHGATRDEEGELTFNGDGTTVEFTLTPAEAHAPVVAAYAVRVGTTPKLYGFDYLINWGDRFGTPQQKATKIIFLEPPGIGITVYVPYRYGKRIVSEKGDVVALGSFINSGFSRGAMPLPKIQCLVEEDTMEAVGIGDNWDNDLQLGNYWHKIRFRCTILSGYADECKMLTDKCVSALMKAAHDNNYLMPEIKPDRIINIDYDLDQKAYVRVFQFSVISREIFG
jgi:hypothetical protein